MQWISLVVASLLASARAGNLRFACSQLVVDRVDPLVSPGIIYSPHLHQIVGGNGFNATMSPEDDPAKQSTCTSCSFAQDFSNYWTAVMFYKAKNGTYKRVPQVANGGPEGLLAQNGGITVYYLYGAAKSRTAFKKGFRMLAGDAANSDPSKVRQSNICHRCWTNPVIDNSTANFVGGAPCSDVKDSVEIPTGPDCEYVRQTIMFPSCWDGVNLDSPDHKSHVAYVQGGDRYGRGGTCPLGYPVKISQIMLEVMWDIRQFKERTAGSFVYSMNNGGTGAHGDYLFGWQDDSLQRALDNGCSEDYNCPAAGITKQANTNYIGCTKKQQAPEDVDDWLAELPMGNKAIKA